MTEQAYEPKPFGPLCLSADGCRGFRVNPYQWCWAHLDPEDRERALSHLAPGGPINACGTHLTPELLTKILAALRRDSGPLELGDARFDGAQFGGDARFDGARFLHGASFRDAWFNGDTKFDRAQFGGDARFDGARFLHGASFPKARCGGDTGFARFARFFAASFREAQFNGDTRFDGARFFHNAWFRGARFLGNARFMGTQFDGDARLEEAFLEAEHILGPVLVKERLALDETTVTQHLVVEAFARQVTCIATEFKQGATIRLRRADVVLDGCMFGRPTTVSFAQLPFRERIGGLTPEGGLQDILFKDKEEEEAFEQKGQRTRPRLLSMRGTDVSNLTLVELNLRHCLFQGAHKRAEIRIVGTPQFADSPNYRMPLFGRIRLWRRWTRRQVLAEEHWYRSCRGREGGGNPLSDKEHWYDPCNCHEGGWNAPESKTLECVANVTGQEIERLTPDRLASVYRALRKAQEDNKNEPGAADFYYGEMEMRRLAAPVRSVERALLSAYKAISGYGLRASRAVAALLVVLALGTIGFATVGFADLNRVEYRPATSGAAGQPAVYQQVTVPAGRPGWGAAIDQSIDSATALLRTDQSRPLTATGRAIEVALRVLGPLLLGLAVLAVRGRVKR